MVPLTCCPAGLVGSFCVGALGASRCLPGSVSLLAVLEWALLVLLLFVLFFFGSFPGCLVWCPGPARTVPWTSFWVSGRSCDGLVDLLSCWECS